MTCKFIWPDASSYFGQEFNVVLTILTMLISIPGNSLTALIIIRNETLRSEPAYLLICSVCLADTLVSTVAQPLYVTTLLIGTRRSCLVDNIYFTFAWISSVSSTLGIITVTFDRYMYIVHPLHYGIYMTNTRARLMIVVVWTVAISFGILPLVYHNAIMLHSSTLLILSLMFIFMAYTYGKVYKKVASGIKPPLPQSSTKKLKLKSQNQATRTVLLVVLAFFGCWFPWVIVSFLVALYGNIKGLQQYHRDSYMMKLYWIFLGVGYCNSALNVFIYSRKNTVLRSTIKKFFGFNNNLNKITSKVEERKGCCMLYSLLRTKLQRKKKDNLKIKTNEKVQTEIITPIKSMIDVDSKSNKYNNNNNNNTDTRQRYTIEQRRKSWSGSEEKLGKSLQRPVPLERHRSETVMTVID